MSRRREEYNFKTRHYAVRYWRSPHFAVAEINRRYENANDWPIAVAVDVGHKLSRQQLIRKACNKATDRILTITLNALR